MCKWGAIRHPKFLHLFYWHCRSSACTQKYTRYLLFFIALHPVCDSCNSVFCNSSRRVRQKMKAHDTISPTLHPASNGIKWLLASVSRTVEQRNLWPIKICQFSVLMVQQLPPVFNTTANCMLGETSAHRFQLYAPSWKQSEQNKKKYKCNYINAITLTSSQKYVNSDNNKNVLIIFK